MCTNSLWTRPSSPEPNVSAHSGNHFRRKALSPNFLGSLSKTKEFRGTPEPG